MRVPDQLRSGDLDLQRATQIDLADVVTLQKAAYAKNRRPLGVEPLPLLAEYTAIMRDMEIWLARQGGKLAGVLILEPRADDLLIWSIATDPAARPSGLGRALLGAAEARASELGRSVLRLYTGTPLTHLVAWYGRHGYAVERLEALSDRSITHMIKHLAPSPVEVT